MKILIFALIVLNSSLAQATDNCKVYIPVKDYWHAGYTIYFEFGNFLKEKKMIEVERVDEANFILLVDGEEAEERYFHHANARLSMTDKLGKSLEYKESIRCLTQLCGIADFGKSFNRAYKKLLKNHPACE